MISSSISNRIDNGMVIPEHFRFQKGQKILYQGEEGEIIRLNPVPVVKTKTRVACGNIHDLNSKHRFHQEKK